MASGNDELQKLSLSLDEIIERERDEPMTDLNENPRGFPNRINRNFGGINKTGLKHPSNRFHRQRGGIMRNMSESNTASSIPPPQIRRPKIPPHDSAIADTECFYNEDGDLIVKLIDTNVITVRKSTGDLSLNTGGWKTYKTLHILNQALKPLGLYVEVAEDGQWRVMDGKAYLENFSDQMVVGVPVSRSFKLARASVVMQNLQQAKKTVELRLDSLKQRRTVPGIGRGYIPQAMHYSAYP